MVNVTISADELTKGNATLLVIVSPSSFYLNTFYVVISFQYGDVDLQARWAQGAW